MSHNFKSAREKMVRTQIAARGIRDEGVLEAMSKVPRERFVLSGYEDQAYSDHPLPIGHDQTISQPYIVALMTEALQLKGEENTLELGTGSGYQAALLAELSREVYTVERIASLLEKAKKTLEDLGYENIHFKVHNGTTGWAEHAPYDAIIVTAGAPKIPKPLLDQLAEGGRMVIPVGNRFSQELMRVTRKDGELKEESLGGVRFVDLIGEFGWNRYSEPP